MSISLLNVRTQNHRQDDLIAQRTQVIADAEALVTKAKNEQRDFTIDEERTFNAAMRDAKILERKIAEAEPIQTHFEVTDAERARFGRGDDQIAPSQWQDRNGQTVHCLAPNQKLGSLTPDDEKLPPGSFGQGVVASVTGNWRRVPSEVRAAMEEGTNSTGGVLVPSKLSQEIIDLARNRSVCIRAGMRTVPMESETLDMARVIEDPAFEVHSENAAMTERDVTLDSVGFHAYSIVCLVRLSRELAADAANAGELVQMVLVRALAAEIDRQCLVGSGSQEMTGLLNMLGLSSTGSVGAIAWADLLTALETIQTANHEPNGYIVHPAIARDLNELAAGDGTNSAATWLGPPPGVDQLSRHVTTNIAVTSDYSAVMGDFSQLLLGLRQQPMVEATTTGGDSFTKHSVLIKCTWRGDVSAADISAFHALTGITS